MAQQRTGVAYRRISGDEEYGNGLPSQGKGISYYMRDNGITEEYTFDETHSGTVLERPQLNIIKDLMRAGKVDCVVVYDASRLARKVGVADFLLDIFEETGVELHIVSWERAVNPKKPRDRQQFNNEAVQSDTERRNILERTNRGKYDLLEDGIVLSQGRDPYGYRTEGRKRNKHFVKVDKQIEVVLLVFRLFVDELWKVADIVRYLNAQGYEPPAQRHQMRDNTKLWTDRRVYDILRNKLYIGKYQYGKLIVVGHKVDANSKRRPIVRSRTEAEITTIDAPGCRVIDDDTFRRAQERLAEGRSLHANAPKHEYLLSRRIRCQCGYKTRSQCRNYKYLYYVCDGQRARIKPDCPLPPSIRTPELDAAVWQAIDEFIHDPNAQLEKLKAAQTTQQVTHREAVMTLERLEQKRAEHAQLVSELYQDYRFKKLITETIYEQLKAPLDRQLAEDEELYSEYQARVAGKILTDAEIETIRRECKRVADYIDQLKARNGSLIFDDMLRTVELLDVQIRLERVEEGVAAHITIYSQNLARVILSLVGSGQPPTVGGSQPILLQSEPSHFLARGSGVCSVSSSARKFQARLCSGCSTIASICAASMA
jgi:site-specific DNA recombinase